MKIHKKPAVNPSTSTELFATKLHVFSWLARLNTSLKSSTSPKQLNLDLIKECHQFMRLDRAGLAWSKQNYPCGYTSYSSLDRLDKLSSRFAGLSKILLSEAKNYGESLRLDTERGRFFIQTMWMNIMHKGAAHTLHRHPGSIISGTVYLALPHGTDAIRFEDPRAGFFMNRPPYREDTEAKGQGLFYTHQPKEGEGVLFESWLSHAVPRVGATKKPRVSVSFNIAWEGS